jgi:hypothetical protein
MPHGEDALILKDLHPVGGAGYSYLAHRDFCCEMLSCFSWTPSLSSSSLFLSQGLCIPGPQSLLAQIGTICPIRHAK